MPTTGFLKANLQKNDVEFENVRFFNVFSGLHSRTFVEILFRIFFHFGGPVPGLTG
jgi:hypothetical protein